MKHRRRNGGRAMEEYRGYGGGVPRAWKSGEAIESPSTNHRTSIEHLSNKYRTAIEHLSNIYRTSIENLSSILFVYFDMPLL